MKHLNKCPKCDYDGGTGGIVERCPACGYVVPKTIGQVITELRDDKRDLIKKVEALESLNTGKNRRINDLFNIKTLLELSMKKYNEDAALLLEQQASKYKTKIIICQSFLAFAGLIIILFIAAFYQG